MRNIDSKSRSVTLLLGTSVAIIALANPAGAADKKEKSPFSFEISAGVEYDGNVSVEEIDQNTAQQDFAGTLDAEVEFETDISKKTELKAGYNFSNATHFDVDGFDIQTHRGSASLEHDFGPASAGLSGLVARSNLDGEGFLTLSRISPAVSGMVGKKVFLRGAYDYTDKDFDNRTDRDAEAHGGGVMAFWFLNGTRTHISGGYKFKTEDAIDDAFDYDAHTIRLRFSNDFNVAGREVEFDIGWRYQTRDYAQFDALIGATREDDRHRYDASLEIPFGDHIFAELEIGYDDRSSNDPTVTVTQENAGFRLGARF